MILANDPKGFSCGEVYALFNPYRSHHVIRNCPCKDAKCNLWQTVQKNGQQKIYETIFNLCPQVQFIVDSSKNPYWIASQIQNLKKTNVNHKTILIWKTPIELAQSFAKRNRSNWDKVWINYHRLYFATIKNWKTLKYSAVTQQKKTLQYLTEYLKIPFFLGKHEFWLKNHHTLFGNDTTRVHLHSKNANQYIRLMKSFEKLHQKVTPNSKSLHRTIYYHKVEDEQVLRDVARKTNKNKYFYEITRILNARDISCKTNTSLDTFPLNMSPLELRTRKFKHNLLTYLRKQKYRSRSTL